MPAPHVSVIVPCYNGERFLKATLDSVFSQSYTDFELIVVDDGSTDGSGSIIKEYGDRVRAVFTENKGVSAARNLGTRLARGALFQYLDADDLLHPDALKLRVAALRGVPLGVAIAEWRELVELSPGQYQFRAHGRPSFHHLSDAEESIFSGFWAPPAAIMYTREIVARIGDWNENLPIIQDARFMLDAAFHGARFVLIPEVLADYRIALHGSLSRANRAKFVADQAKNLADIETRWHANGVPSAQRMKLLGDAHGAVVRAWFEIDRGKFRAALSNARRLDPSFIPNGSNAYRWLCQLIGVGLAERIAFYGRACKRMIKSKAPT
jgi:glycosyltransferase involved in cell wall biosynthesis